MTLRWISLRLGIGHRRRRRPARAERVVYGVGGIGISRFAGG
jgi:hypothetical protein